MSDRQSNRTRYPQIARIVDELRETFGSVSVTSLEPQDSKETA